jgi:hypothetical protein
MRKWLERFRDAFNWGWLAYRVAWVFVATGIASAIGGGVWAVLIGVPLPIAIMAGYCTLVGAVYLGIAPLAYRVLIAPTGGARLSKAPQPPNYQAARLLKDYTLGEASHMWCDVDPIANDTYDTSIWFKVLKAKAQEKILVIVPPEDKSRRVTDALYPTLGTRVTRESLQAFAKSVGEVPRFLRDKD